RCDGRVCKILHDPDIPPLHQYIATYMYMDRIFGADVLIHVGTHGNLEWLPGKGGVVRLPGAIKLLVGSYKNLMCNPMIF
ncbi:MAG: cobaltochelatase subunit CobN, partial [Desulfobacca sp.]|nr:cobaltochelatase subunit CobN [Desulfobacca sp.]